MKEYKPALYAHQFAETDNHTGERTSHGNGIYLGCDDKEVTEKSFTEDGELLCGIVEFYSARDFKELQSRLEQAEKDAARYQLQKKFPHIKIDHFGGKYRAHCIHKILTDWVDSYDEAFDTAMQKESTK